MEIEPLQQPSRLEIWVTRLEQTALLLLSSLDLEEMSTKERFAAALKCIALLTRLLQRLERTEMDASLQRAMRDLQVKLRTAGPVTLP
ncbi:hypothetical protein EI42_04944 [Thermosporothrix hazakensis]|jgi:hypothetical protein|uniref:Uncharacterized protein n=2 Tax=Thermosporothrix TaxID=768650 RepID=A0A326U1J6_THEHA|nr:hypothetical protein [Thermosporothrix hazakensis]PZW23561.1 hypothetical protein EI42_04944 [Thermosporothrix hazakensis]BBH86770.1 hypothetical protein KTC_15210 [Thermosporothrix sp. COM3]GCE51073.1 hypothetical protein KTH_59420 [Thermosporothrix hazakensis]